MLKSEKHISELIRKQIAAVNWERKRSQTASGARLRALRRRWAQLVADNYRLERALLQLQQQREKVGTTFITNWDDAYIIYKKL